MLNFCGSFSLAEVQQDRTGQSVQPLWFAHLTPLQLSNIILAEGHLPLCAWFVLRAVTLLQSRPSRPFLAWLPQAPGLQNLQMENWQGKTE